MQKKRKEVAASVPARIREPGSECPHVVASCSKSISLADYQISSSHPLQKKWRWSERVV
jgi:hypothetical protein